jgi:hypothetical protein
MKLNIQRRLLAVLIVISIPSVPSGNAQNLNLKASLGLEAKVGLDDRTLDLFNRFPQDLQDHMLQLLKDSLPLIDVSVLKYLDRVNNILDVQISHLQCSVTGAAKQLSDQIKATVGFKQEDLVSLRKDWDSTKASFNQETSPLDYEIIYGDFLLRAAATRCQADISPEASQTVAVLQSQARPRWRVWYRVEKLCSSAANCFDTVSSIVSTKIKDADVRDDAEVDAAATLASIAKPAPKGVFQPFNQLPWEDKIMALLAISDAIDIAKAARQAKAAQAWSTAQEALPPYQFLLNTESSEVQWPTNVGQDYGKALTRLPQVIQTANSISEDGKTAADLDSKFSDDYMKLKNKLDNDIVFANSLYNRASAGLKHRGKHG